MSVRLGMMKTQALEFVVVARRVTALLMLTQRYPALIRKYLFNQEHGYSRICYCLFPRLLWQLVYFFMLVHNLAKFLASKLYNTRAIKYVI